MSQSYDEERGYKGSRAPMEYVDAVEAARLASQAQEDAEGWLADKFREFAEAEKAYRKRLAGKILELKGEGVAVTAARDVAFDDDEVCELRFKRDVAEGLKEAAVQSMWRHTADRRDCEGFLDWSKRASFIGERPA